MNTSEKIRYLRLNKGLSQEELGKMVGLQKAAINKYETGRVVNIKKSMLQKLASALDVQPADLLDDTEETLTPLDKRILAYVSGINETGVLKLMEYAEYIKEKYPKDEA